MCINLMMVKTSVKSIQLYNSYILLNFKLMFLGANAPLGIASVSKSVCESDTKSLITARNGYLASRVARRIKEKQEYQENREYQEN